MIDEYEVRTVDETGAPLPAPAPGVPRPNRRRPLDDVVQRGVIVCHASRVCAGPVLATAGRTARRIISADDLQPWKARVLLMLAMTITKDVTEIQQMFEHN